MAFDRARLIRAIETLEKYYGLTSVDDLLRTVALESVIAQPIDTNNQRNLRPINNPNQIETEILQTLFHDRTALYSTKSALKLISQKINSPNIDETTKNELIGKLNRTLQIFYNREAQTSNSISLVTTTEFSGTHLPYNSILEMLGSNSNFDNLNQNEPTKTNSHISFNLCNSHRLNFNQFYGNLLTIWMNGIPTEELAKSTPFFNIEFNTPRSAVDINGKLSALGLNKFIYGARLTNGQSDPFYTTSKANQNSLTIQNQTSESTIVGMEIFTSPVGLRSGQELTEAEHSNRILDTIQPFLSIEDLALTVAPSNGLMSFKTGTLTLKLHDRTRLADIAELIRPEYYGLNEIMIEYGWIHPEAEFNGNISNNPFADLINNLRVKEKYGIINSSFNFDGTGGVKISLNLAMRGSTEMFTETIASSSSNLQNIMAELEIVRSALETIRNRFPDGRIMGREIRGFDIINGLSDSTYNFTLGREFLNNLRTLQQTISQIPQLSDLRNQINNLVEQTSATGSRNTTVTGGIIRRAQTTILQEVQTKIANLINPSSPDPMLLQVQEDLSVAAVTPQQRAEPGTFVELPADNSQRRRELNDALTAIGITNIGQLPEGQFSLAKLMLEFVAKPLAATRKYDDIQFFFYPFNVYAGRANRLNVGNFGIDARLFIMRYMEWRLGRLNQSLNVNLNEFLRFVIDQIVSEPSAKSYGLYSPVSEGRNTNAQAFRYFVENGSIQIRTESTTPGRRGQAEEADGGAYLQQLTKRLENVTPNAEFRPPQIEFHVEALPMKEFNAETNTEEIIPSKTVLRIHVFDRVASSLESLSQLEMAARDLSIQSIGTAWTNAQSSIRNIGATDPNADPNARNQTQRIPTNEEANEIINSARQNLENMIEIAKTQGLITQAGTRTVSLHDSTGAETTDTVNVYRVTGGPENLREFFRKNAPHLLYGAAGTTVKSPTFSSLQDSSLSTIMMMRSNTRAELQSNGENPGGLPMQVAPGECEIPMLGFPLVPYLQNIFCDFQTGTTIDNFYAVTGITHNLGPGKFETKLKLTPIDGYGKYINIMNVVNTYVEEIRNLGNRTVSDLSDQRIRESR